MHSVSVYRLQGSGVHRVDDDLLISPYEYSLFLRTGTHTEKAIDRSTDRTIVFLLAVLNYFLRIFFGHRELSKS